MGIWNWWILGFILLTGELIIPGILLLWFGLAALTIGIISVPLWDQNIWTWQIQTFIFLVLSTIYAIIGKRLVTNKNDNSDQPLLNQRGAQLIGKSATLIDPIKNGRGRIRINDTTWNVSGPDMDKGSSVKIIDVKSNELKVIKN